MFTGLVEALGTVVALDRHDDAVVALIAPDSVPLAELSIGESICHDGACLTVTEITDRGYTVLAGAETLARTTVGQWQVGSQVNLERSLRLGDRLGGHWVTGHVDGTGVLVERLDQGANIVLRFAAPAALLRYIVAKGSIAVAGVSLTVNTVDAESFAVAIIPHTATHTTLGAVPVQGAVNLEADVIAKHVEKLVAPR